MISTLTTQNLILSAPSSGDLSGINDFEMRNNDHLKKWESTTSAKNQPVYEETKKRLDGWIKECKEGRSARFFIRSKDNHSKIIGFCNFTQIFHGSFQACYLGYKIDHECEGKGLMFEALEAAIRYVFEELGIHRIMANYMPTNTRSAKLLNHLGFTVEGYAKNYLLINSQWEDHILTALSVEQWEQQSKRSFSSNEESEKNYNDNLIIRECGVKDINSMVVLSHRKRLLYEKAEPQFWRYAKGAEDIQSQWFEELLTKNDYILLLAEFKKNIVGFIIGQIIKAPEVYAPHGLTLMVDDFCVSPPLWKDIAIQLLNKIKVLAKIKGAQQIVVVSGAHDQFKREFLKNQGLRVATEWHIGEISSYNER